MLTQQPGTVTMTDPLAMQFMTGGQMQYMPQAQFLTPAEYGAFRTMPMSPPHAYAHQDPGFFQSWLIRNQGGPFGLPKYTFNTYNPAVNQQEYMNRMYTRSYDTYAATLSAIGDWGLSGIASLALAPLGLPATFAATMLMPAMAPQITDRIRDMRAIQNLTMSKIVGGSDVNFGTGMGFNAVSARNIDSFMRMSAAKDVVLKEGDWRKLLQLGVENGQFDYANNVHQYKDILKKMRSNLTTVMEVIGSTDFKDLMKEMKRLQTMGAGMDDYKRILRTENMYARATGLSHADMVSTYGQQGAMIYNQAGLTPAEGSLAAMGHAATITMAQRMGIIDSGTVARYGGVSGMTQRMTQQSAGIHSKIIDHILPYFLNEKGDALDPNKKLSDLIKMKDPLHVTSRSLQQRLSTPEGYVTYMQNRSKLYEQLLAKNGEETVRMVAANAVGRTLGARGKNATTQGSVILGVDPALAGIMVNNYYSKEAEDLRQRERHIQRLKEDEERSLYFSPTKRFGRWIDSFITGIQEDLFGSIVYKYGKNKEEEAYEASGYYGGSGAALPEVANQRNWNGDPDRFKGGVVKEKVGVKDLQVDLDDVGSLSENFESDRGKDYIDWYKGAGTLYGNYQISSNKGSGKDFIQWLKDNGYQHFYEGLTKVDEKGNRVSLLKDYGSKEASKNSEGAKAWEELNRRYGAEFKYAQRAFISDKYVNQALNNLNKTEAGREAAKLLQQTKTMREVNFSTVVHFGAFGATKIYREAYKPGMTAQQFAKEIYRLKKEKQPGTRYEHDEPYIVEKMFEQESKAAAQAGYNQNGSYDPKSDLMAEFNASIEESNRESTGVKYDFGGNDPKPGGKGIDCSGWTKYILKKALQGKMFSEEARKVVEKYRESGELFSAFVKASGKSAITEGLGAGGKNVRGGLIVFLDKKRSKGHPRHIVTTFTGADGKVYVTESTSGIGVRTILYDDWIKQHENRYGYIGAVDVRDLENPVSKAARQQASAMGLNPSNKSAEELIKENSRIIDEAMQMANPLDPSLHGMHASRRFIEDASMGLIINRYDSKRDAIKSYPDLIDQFTEKGGTDHGITPEMLTNFFGSEKGKINFSKIKDIDARGKYIDNLFNYLLETKKQQINKSNLSKKEKEKEILRIKDLYNRMRTDFRSDITAQAIVISAGMNQLKEEEQKDVRSELGDKYQRAHDDLFKAQANYAKTHNEKLFEKHLHAEFGGYGDFKAEDQNKIKDDYIKSSKEAYKLGKVYRFSALYKAYHAVASADFGSPSILNRIFGGAVDKEKLMEQYKEKFLKAAEDLGIKKEDAEQIFIKSGGTKVSVDELMKYSPQLLNSGVNKDVYARMVQLGEKYVEQQKERVDVWAPRLHEEVYDRYEKYKKENPNGVLPELSRQYNASAASGYVEIARKAGFMGAEGVKQLLTPHGIEKAYKKLYGKGFLTKQEDELLHTVYTNWKETGKFDLSPAFIVDPTGKPKSKYENAAGYNAETPEAQSQEELMKQAAAATGKYAMPSQGGGISDATGIKIVEVLDKNAAVLTKVDTTLHEVASKLKG